MTDLGKLLGNLYDEAGPGRTGTATAGAPAGARPLPARDADHDGDVFDPFAPADDGGRAMVEYRPVPYEELREPGEPGAPAGWEPADGPGASSWEAPGWETPGWEPGSGPGDADPLPDHGGAGPVTAAWRRGEDDILPVRRGRRSPRLRKIRVGRG